MQFKPMKAENCDLSLIRFPVVCLVKLDGVWSGQMPGFKFTSRTLKPFKNSVVRDIFSHPLLAGFNGELAVGSLTDGATCRRTSSVVNSYSWNSSGEIPTLYPFDYVCENTVRMGFVDRFNLLRDKIDNLPLELAQYVKPLPAVKICKTLEEVLAFHEMVTGLGYEGTILRWHLAPHKNGRSTVKEGYLLRLKDQETDEAIVLSLVEAEENQNIAQINELGETFRTSHQENKVGKGMVGSFLCLWKGIEISVSAGELDHDERREIWETRNWVGRTITFKFMRYGMKDKPRFARYVAPREDL